MTKLMLISAIALVNFSAVARELDESHLVFNSKVHTVVLKVSRETEKLVLAGGKESGPLQRFCLYYKVIEDEKEKDAEKCVENASYKVRGNTSKDREKRQYKIKFKNKDFFGLKAINLRSGGRGTNDHSMARELFAGRMFNDLAYRSAHAKFFVELCNNDGKSCSQADYRGLYMLAEELDGEFLEDRFRQAKGVLISTAYANDNARADFRLEHLNSKSFEVERAELSDEQWASIERSLPQEFHQCNTDMVKSRGYKDKELQAGRLICATLVKLQSIVSRRNVEELKDLFDMQNIYSYMAGANFTGHWDSLIGNANNDFLFFNPEIRSPFGGKWQVLVWDLDVTMGNSADEQKFAGHLKFPIRVENELFKFILSDSSLRREYEEAYKKIVGKWDQGELIVSLNRMEARVRDSVRGTWEETNGIDYHAAFEYLRDFVNTRFDSVSRSLRL